MRLALAWSLGSIALATIMVALGLLLVDLQQYAGNCPGSLLPFLGDPEPRACSFGEYFTGHGLLTFEVLVRSVWPIALLFVSLAAAFGLAMDRQHRDETDGA